MRREASRWCVTSLILSALAGAPGAAATAADWPQWRGPNRDGTSPQQGLSGRWPPKELWRTSVGEGYASVSVAAGRAYTIGHARGEGGHGTDTVFCFDAARGGEPVWKKSYPCATLTKDRTAEYAGPRATPLCDGDSVFTIGIEGQLFCLDAATGAVRWEKDLTTYAVKDAPPMYGYCASPMVHGETLLCFLNGACMAFDRKTGKPLWRRQGGAGPWNVPSPVVVSVDGQTHVIIGETALVGVNVADGKKAWEHNLGRSATMTPVVAGERIFFSTYPNKGHCGLIRLGAGGPEVVWQNRSMQVYHVGTPVVWGTALFGIDAARTEFSYSDARASSLVCLDLQTGAEKWRERSIGWAQLIAADGVLLILREEGDLVAAEASAERYRELGRQKVIDGPAWALPALADGRVYCRSNAGVVVCLELGSR